MNDYKMTPGELRATWGLGTVFSLRMLGMFMVLPVLTTYGMALQGASEALIGLAIGIYGLAQAVFQIPFGLLSDRVGRKPLIVGGLLVFVLGSVIAALSHSIWGYSWPRPAGLRRNCRRRDGAAVRSHPRAEPHQGNGLYRRQLWRDVCDYDGARPCHHPQTGAARPVLDDCRAGDHRDRAYAVGGAGQQNHVLNH